MKLEITQANGERYEVEAQTQNPKEWMTLENLDRSRGNVIVSVVKKRK